MSSDAAPTISPQAAKLKAQLDALGAVPFFEKCLTNSDVGTHGRVVLPKAIAESQFTDFLERQGATLVGEDVDGNSYDFKFRFWTNNQSRMYLIEGCAELLRKYKVTSGNVICFAKKADGTLVVAGRPAGPEDALKRAPVRTRAPKADDKSARAAKVRRKNGPQTDGIFRAAADADPAKKVFLDQSVWTCVIDVAGEPYKALFDLEADAWEAYRAAVGAAA